MVPRRKVDVSEVNRDAWNEAAPIHGKYDYDFLLNSFKKSGFSCIAGIKKDILLAHGLRGKAVFQPCCYNGRALLSIKNLGAKRCFGFDLSDEFIEQGRQFAEAGGIECEFIQADVYKLGNDYDDQFDIGYITAGTFMWLSDLNGFFAIVARLLRKGGWLFIQEIHPILDMYGMEPSKKRRRFEESYFRETPYKVTRGLDYYSSRPYRAKPCYRFHHKLSDIIQALVNNGLIIETFEERDENQSGGNFRWLQKTSIRPPLSYILTAFLS